MTVWASDPSSLTLDGTHHSELPAPQPRSPVPPSQSRLSVSQHANFIVTVGEDAAQSHPQCLRDPEKAGGGAMDVEEVTLPLPLSHPLSATTDHKTHWGKESQPVTVVEKPSGGVHQQAPLSSPPESRRASSSSGWVRYSSSSSSSTHDRSRSIAESDVRHKSTYVWRVLVYIYMANHFLPAAMLTQRGADVPYLLQPVRMHLQCLLYAPHAPRAPIQLPPQNPRPPFQRQFRRDFDVAPLPAARLAFALHVSMPPSSSSARGLQRSVAGRRTPRVAAAGGAGGRHGYGSGVRVVVLRGAAGRQERRGRVRVQEFFICAAAVGKFCTCSAENEGIGGRFI
jgi:hypothetical protein